MKLRNKEDAKLNPPLFLHIILFQAYHAKNKNFIKPRPTSPLIFIIFSFTYDDF